MITSTYSVSRPPSKEFKTQIIYTLGSLEPCYKQHISIASSNTANTWRPQSRNKNTIFRTFYVEQTGTENATLFFVQWVFETWFLFYFHSSHCAASCAENISLAAEETALRASHILEWCIHWSISFLPEYFEAPFPLSENICQSVIRQPRTIRGFCSFHVFIKPFITAFNAHIV